jgi:hypothetical protein
VSAVVYTSSTSVYPQDGGVRVDESAATGGTERAEVLLATEHTLLAAEDAAVTAAVGWIDQLATTRARTQVIRVEGAGSTV